MKILIGTKMIDVSKFEIRDLYCGETVWVKPARTTNETETLFNETGKLCKACGEFVEWSGYGIISGHLGGNCGKCINKRSRQRYVNNKNKVSEQSKRWRRDNKDKVNKANKKYRSKHKERLIEYNKQYNTSNAKYDTNRLPLGYTCESDEGGYLLISCYKCGKLHHTTNSQLISLIRAQSGKVSVSNNIYCSDQCKKSCSVYKKNHVVLADRHMQNLPMHSPKQTNRPYVKPSLIQEALIRDNHTCQKCGKTQCDTNLYVHHVIGATRHPEFANDINNCITLCEDCHRDLHSRDGCTPYDYRLDKK